MVGTSDPVPQRWLGLVEAKLTRRPRLRRTVWLLVLITLAIGAVAGPQAYAAQKDRNLPEIDIALAAFKETEGSVGIAVKVQKADAVSVAYGGVQRDATKVIATSFWWDTSFNGAAQSCYRITVRARNDHGTVERRVGAGLLGTTGCVDCSEAEAKVGQKKHKVKRARAAVRNADSKSEARTAKRRLARAKNRLQKALVQLEACLG